jgi:formylglycine-generating enzyme required for sulfatase activity
VVRTSKPIRSVPLRVFIAYTAEDLHSYADVVRKQLQKLQWIAVDHQDWAATGNPSVAECRNQVRSCHVLVVLVAHRYGWVPTKQQGGDDERCITWIEVDEAYEAGLEVLPFLVDPKTAWPVPLIEALSNRQNGERLEQFKDHLSGKLCNFFTTPESLASSSYHSLYQAGQSLRSGYQTGLAPIESYTSSLEARFKDFELLGLGDQLSVRLPLRDAYVPLRAYITRSLDQHRELSGRDNSALQNAEWTKGDVLVEEVFRSAEEFGLRAVVLFGDPGMGKTTLARYLTWLCASAEMGPPRLGLAAGTIPLYIPVRYLQTEDLSKGPAGLILKHLQKNLVDTDLDPAQVSPFLTNNILWILDGLDEVADTVLQSAVYRWLRQTIEGRLDDHFLLTARYAGAKEIASLSAQVLTAHIQPLDDGQTSAFVQGWYRAVEQSVRGICAEADEMALNHSSSLLSALGGIDNHSVSLRVMASNPLLLSIICLVHRKDHSLPQQPSVLYGKCLDVLFEHWQASKGLPYLEAAAGKAILAPLAWWLQQVTGRTEGSREDCERQVATSLRAVADRAGLSPEVAHFLDLVCDSCGVLVRPGPDRFGFLHRTFQEYLAAQYAVDHRQELALVDRFGDNWWEEVITLSLSLAPEPFSVEFFRALLRSPSLHSKAELASRCVAETLWFPERCFAEYLMEATQDPVDLMALLRLLRTRHDTWLIESCKSLREHSSSDVSALAKEILLRSAPSIEPQANLNLTPRTGDTMIFDPSGILLLYIEGGEFVLGSPKGRRNESPPHRVKLSPFWISKYPVTNAEYSRFLEATPRGPRPRYWKERRLNAPGQPVVGLSWQEVQLFCRWSGLSLPTEAQWEYACRAGSTTRFSCGDSEESLDTAAWYFNNAFGQTHPVGEKKANLWGLHDMHGNVWEWTADWMGVYSAALQADPLGPERGTERVIRGGSFLNPAENLPSSYRSSLRTGKHWHMVGFRVVLRPEPETS